MARQIISDTFFFPVAVGSQDLCNWIAKDGRLFCFKIKISWHKCLSLWESKAEDHRKIEAFLNNHGSYAPKRYNYSEIKRITSRFKNKLGQGGFGIVYRESLANAEWTKRKW